MEGASARERSELTTMTSTDVSLTKVSANLTTPIHSPTSSHVASTSQLSTYERVASLGSSSSSSSSNQSSFYPFNSTMPTQMSAGEEGLPGGLVVLIVGLAVLGVSLVAMVIYLKTTGKLRPKLPCKGRMTRRRSSTSGSRRPLDVDEGEVEEGEGRREDDLPVAREVAMFTIDDFEPVYNDEFSRRTTSEEYFYDEVFGQSMFEDEMTNASMRHLYLEDEDTFDLDTALHSVSSHPPHPRLSSSSGRKT